MTTMNIYDMADTWNDAGTTFTAIKMNVTNTASNAASLLMDLQVGGASMASIVKTGKVNSAVGFYLSNSQDSGFYSESANVAGLGRAASKLALNFTATTDIVMPAEGQVAFSSAARNSSATSIVSGVDTILTRDAANTLAQRLSTNAQTFRWYHTYTDSANRQNGALKTAAGYVELAAETVGTGADDIDVLLTPAGTGAVRFGTHAAIGSETITGYITIKDAGGTERKIAVVS